jgi:hypothetical protein
MLLTKIKAAGLVLLLAASVGAVGLTYRTAIAQTGPGEQTVTKAAAAEKYDLEALRLEVEALRASLQATRERVKALEAREQSREAAETPATPETGIPFVTAAIESATPSPKTVLDANKTPAASPEMKAGAPPEGSLAKAFKMMAGGQAAEAEARVREVEAHRRADVEARVKAAAEQLRIRPADKKAQDAMKQALEQMNRLSEPKPTNVQGR